MTDKVEGTTATCTACPDSKFKYIDDKDNGDWVEAVYECNTCGKRIYIELPD